MFCVKPALKHTGLSAVTLPVSLPSGHFIDLPPWRPLQERPLRLSSLRTSALCPEPDVWRVQGGGLVTPCSEAKRPFLGIGLQGIEGGVFSQGLHSHSLLREIGVGRGGEHLSSCGQFPRVINTSQTSKPSVV